MKNRVFATVIASAFSLTLIACSKPSEPGAETNAVGLPVVTKIDCPQADDNGQLDIAPGLKATVVNKGYGRAAVTKDYADVHATLWLYDESAEGGRGAEIWSSGGVQPFQFQLDAEQVIDGWDMGVPCMLVGETRELIVSPELAYGARGKPPVPPNATLLFTIELLKLTTPNAS